MISIHRVVLVDIETYIALERRVVSRTYSAMLTIEEVAELIKKGPVYLIKNGDIVVGSISYEMRPDSTVYLSGLVIDPTYQGRGFGKIALEQILREVEDAPRIELLTHPDNIKAISLYRSLDFKITGRIENPYGDGEPRVIMTRQRQEEII